MLSTASSSWQGSNEYLLLLLSYIYIYVRYIYIYTDILIFTISQYSRKLIDDVPSFIFTTARNLVCFQLIWGYKRHCYKYLHKMLFSVYFLQECSSWKHRIKWEVFMDFHYTLPNSSPEESKPIYRQLYDVIKPLSSQMHLTLGFIIFTYLLQRDQHQSIPKRFEFCLYLLMELGFLLFFQIKMSISSGLVSSLSSTHEEPFNGLSNK